MRRCGPVNYHRYFGETQNWYLLGPGSADRDANGKLT